MHIDEDKIAQIVERVVTRLEGPGGHSHGPNHRLPAPESVTLGGAAPASPTVFTRRHAAGADGVFDDMDAAIAAANDAFTVWRQTSLDTRKKVIDAMRAVSRAELQNIARMAVEETGLGRYEDKLAKNTLVIEKTPGVEILKPNAHSGDDGLMITERAPYGVIAAITPCTNPTETILNNGINMIAGGNSAVFNVHPASKRLNAYQVRYLNKAIVANGGPPNLLCCIAEPTIESAQLVMRHEGTRLVVVTGGGAVVKEAMRSGKRAISAGPGNPPVLVDETADLRRAAKGVIDGHSIDNNIICTAEKVLIAVDQIADALKAEMKRHPVAELNRSQIEKLRDVIITKDDHINRKFVGKNAAVIAREIGLNLGDEVRTLLCEVDEAHPFVQHEQLMPVLPMVRVRDADEGINAAVRVEHGYFHTSVMYSRNIEAMHRMARAVNTSIFVKNAPNLAGLGLGGEGYTSFTIASPTGEGLTTAISFTRERRCTLKEYFRFV